MTAAVLDRVQSDVLDVTVEAAEPPLAVMRPALPIGALLAASPVEIAPDAAGVDEVHPDEAESPTVRLDALVRAALSGRARAIDDLLAEIHPFVLRYCRGRLGRQETVAASAEDVAQEVCLAVISALPGYTLRGLSFRAFVYGIAAHKVTDAFRAIGRSRTEPVSDLPDSPSTDDGPENRMLAVELSGRLERLLEVLTPRQRDVLVLRIMVGLSAEETAAIVRSTPGAVRVTQHRALNRLRAVLEGVTPDQVAPSAP